MTPKNIQLHNHCECAIRWRLFRGHLDPTPGLFCVKHDAFIDWLTKEMAYLLIDSGVREEIYKPRVKSKKPKQLNVIKERKKKRAQIRKCNTYEYTRP